MMIQLVHMGVRVLAIAMITGAIALLTSQILAAPGIVGTGLRIDQLEGQIVAVERENRTLRELIAYRQSDNYVVAVAKRELGLVEPGDTQLRVVGIPPAISLPPIIAVNEAATPTATTTVKQPMPVENFSAWWNVLTGADT